MTVAFIVPWRDKGDTWRHANLVTVLAHLEAVDLGVIEVVDDGLTGATPFNRSAAYNRGVALHPTADVFVFHEADMLIPKRQLESAISLASRPGMVVPFDTYHYLAPTDTRRVRAGANPSSCIPEMVMADGRSNGAVNVVSSATMRAVGRWDESFSGWGFDDRAMARAFDVASGAATRYVTGPGHHLWHTPGWSADSRFHGGSDIPPHEHAATVANEARFRLYRKARTPTAIRELTAGAR